MRVEGDGGGAGVDSSIPLEVGAMAADRARAQVGRGGDLAVALPSTGRRSTSCSRAVGPVAKGGPDGGNTSSHVGSATASVAVCFGVRPSPASCGR